MHFGRTLVFAGVSFFFLMLALLAGIFRLMYENSLETGVLASLYLLHPILMVFGFLAGIVMTERLSGLSVMPSLKDSNLPTVMVPLIAFGVIGEILGYVSGISFMKYVGALLLFGGCLVFAYVLAQLSKRTGIKMPFWFMILSVVSLSGAALLSALTLPADHMGFIMLLVGFPAIFILGERVELSRFTSSASTNSKYRQSFVLALLSVALFIAGSLPIGFEPGSYIVVAGSVTMFVSFFSMWLVENKNFKQLSKSPQPLQRYVVAHTRIAYFWGMLGLALAAAYAASLYGLDLYDSSIHSITIGFIGTMLLAHGPVILPSVTGRRLRGLAFSKVPLYALTFANVVRIGGDLLFSAGIDANILHYIVGLSGFMILASVLLFLSEIMRKTERLKVMSIQHRNEELKVGSPSLDQE